jgi:hypothetical protein
MSAQVPMTASTTRLKHSYSLKLNLASRTTTMLVSIAAERMLNHADGKKIIKIIFLLWNVKGQGAYDSQVNWK